MSIFEYDEKLHEKTLLEIGREEGIQQGMKQGMQGTVTALKSMGCTDDAIIEKLIEVYGLDVEEAMKILELS